MAAGKTRAELQAEIIEVHKRQIESNRQATFGGWTRQEQEEHWTRSDHISALYRQLAALDET